MGMNRWAGLGRHESDVHEKGRSTFYILVTRIRFSLRSNRVAPLEKIISRLIEWTQKYHYFPLAALKRGIMILFRTPEASKCISYLKVLDDF